MDSSIAPNTAAFEKDVGLTAEILTLAAVEQGFGGCMIGSFDRKEIVRLLGLEEKMVPALLLSLIHISAIPRGLSSPWLSSL